MKFFRKFSSLLVAIVALVGLMQFSVPAVSAANVFGGSKEEACKGAKLSENPDVAQDCDKAAADSLTKTIGNIINLLSLIIGIVAVIVLIFGGFRYITSGGESAAVTTAKNTILYAIIGLVVVALAQFIVRFVLHTATK